MLNLSYCHSEFLSADKQVFRYPQLADSEPSSERHAEKQIRNEIVNLYFTTHLRYNSVGILPK